MLAPAGVSEDSSAASGPLATAPGALQSSSSAPAPPQPASADEVSSKQTALGVFTGHMVSGELNGAGTFACAEETAAPGGGGDTAAASSPEEAFLVNVATYDGTFRAGLFDGRGTLRYKDGAWYEGPFVGGFPEGDGGRLTYADGRVYDGAFAAGQPHGHGRLTETSGDTYDGEFVRGARQGFGTACYGNGARVFTGQWSADAKVKGRLMFPGSDRVYDGSWRDERPHGKGMMVFANGDRYEGDFEGGVLQGVGLLTYAMPSGSKFYYGQFLSDQPYGTGQLVVYPPACPAGAAGGTAPAPQPSSTVKGYFKQGQLVDAEDAAAIAEVVEATRLLPPPPPLQMAQMESRLLCRPSDGSPPKPDRPSTAADQATSAPTPVARERNDSPAGDQAVSTTETGAATQDAPTGSRLPVGPGDSSTPTRPADQRDASGVDAPTHAGDEDEADDCDSEESPPDGPLQGSFAPSFVAQSFSEETCKGWLEKCSIGRSRLGLFSNWKRRFFLLASLHGNVCLGYYEDELCRKPIGFLRFSPDDTRIVTRPSSRTHKKASKPGRELCIIYHEHHKTYKLLLRAADASEHDRWTAAMLRYFTIVDRPTDFPLSQ